MSSADLSDQIQALHTLRLDAAARSQALALRELDGRLLRLQVEGDLQGAGMTKTDAAKQVHRDPKYDDFERETVRLVYERERVLAEAEAALLNIKLQLAVLNRETFI